MLRSSRKPVTARIYGYVRVSTMEQATDRSSLDDQERRIRGTAMMRGEDVEAVIADPGVSGSIPISQRPGGRRLIDTVERGDIVIAAKMDRIFRSTEDALVTAREFKELGVSLIIADLGADPVTENGVSKLFFTILAGCAEFERGRIAERVAEGRASKARAGGAIGGRPPVGKRVVGQGRTARLEDDPYELETIVAARAFRAQGLSLSQIGVRLAEEGRLNRVGKPYAKQQVHRWLTPVVEETDLTPSAGLASLLDK